MKILQRLVHFPHELKPKQQHDCTWSSRFLGKEHQCKYMRSAEKFVLFTRVQGNSLHNLEFVDCSSNKNGVPHCLDLPHLGFTHELRVLHIFKANHTSKSLSKVNSQRVGERNHALLRLPFLVHWGVCKRDSLI